MRKGKIRDEVKHREITAARSERQTERNVIRRLVRQAQTIYTVICDMMSGTSLQKRKSLKELYLDGTVTGRKKQEVPERMRQTIHG